jgi:flagellar motor protein MotB
MRFARMGFVAGTAVVVLALVSTGCQSKVHKENEALWQQNRELQQKLTETAAAPKAQPQDQAQLAALQQQVAERDAKLNELQSQLRQPATGATNEAALSGIETHYDKAAGKMTVNLPGDVLFLPGDATVRDNARSTLDKVALSLKKDYAGKHVRIDGHTDSDPIKHSRWKSNMELSEARAAAVKAYLVKKGVNASLVTIKGYGADKPKTASKNKDTNRRVEIVVATR